jgi:ATP-dependent helicase HrpA
VPNEAARHNPVPLVYKHDPDLPIFARRQDILDALERHQLLIVAGDTGSGKSTQLPKYCLELGRGPGRGRGGVIAHTQPRRLAARSLAARIAEELAEPVGRTVGFRVRFADRVSEATRLTLMTDGLLLAELNSDPDLRRYDTLIVDEAHERSLNVDLLLGVVKRLLPRRPDLKVIITSATLAVERVSRFFDDAPILTVSGRSHPIEVRYTAPPEDADDPDLAVEVLGAYLDIATTPGPIGSGDVLVFLPGEREIRDVAELLERELQKVEVLPLFSRLSWEQQSKIFERGPRQRIVLATNVAETSITVPGIRAVIDSGLARISRYSPRNRLQRLPIEPVSRASAEQRKGRCGRIGAGLCVRLYSREDFEARPEFTEPEVLRTNLAALLLRLAADGLGEAETFPFIDPPESRALGDGYRLLQELEALDGERRITGRGQAMARLPLDPRLARALLESRRYRAESELLALVAGLSVPDVRLRAPVSKTQEETGEDDPAAAFDDPRSEFSGLVRLWRAYRKARQGPRRELRRWCKERQLSLLRLSEWDDVYAQVADRAAELSIVPQARPASYAAVHRSLLAGFCTNVGVRGEEGEYTGTRGVRFHIFPGSPLRRRKPKWVMAAYIVETSRVYARRVAEIEPSWIEAAARHLLKREFLEPDWDEAREQVIARERISFLGLTLSANRIVNYGPIAPEESRLIFSREALVFGRLARRPEWLMANDAALREAELLEERLRVRDLVQTAEYFVDLYARLLPRQVSSAAALEHLTRNLSESQRQALMFAPEQIFARAPERERLEQFPQAAAIGPLSVPVEYRFAPGEADDGATLRVPLLALPTLTRAAVDAAIPGLIEQRVSALLRSLPKEARRSLIPIAAAAQAFLTAAAPRADAQAVRTWVTQVRGVPQSLAQFDSTQVPPHLSARVLVVSRGRELGAGVEHGELRRRFALEARRELDEHSRRSYPGAWRRFEAPVLPEAHALDLEAGPLPVYPALVRSAGGLDVRYEWTAEEAARSFRDGALALARLILERQARDLEKRIGGDAQLLLRAVPYFTRDALVDTLLDLIFRRACFGDSEPPRERAAFEAALERGRAELHTTLEEVASAAAGWFSQARDVRRLLDDPRAKVLGEAVHESRVHLERLLDAAFLRSLSGDWLRQVPRWLRGEERRWQRALARGSEPAAVLAELREWEGRCVSLAEQSGAELRRPPGLDALRLWVEEYRVSLYAQDLKTVGPVSAARLVERAAALEVWIAR